ncbi:unnamed protein product [Lathyrus sativus]|nr:unnamed protein product [Lathyrus sativus]
MEFELMEFPNKEEKKAILETASDSINSLGNFIDFLSHNPSNLNSDLTNTTVTNFKKLSNLLNRTGRARFRRAPLPQPPQNPSPTPTPTPSASTTPPQVQPQNHSLTLDFTKPNMLRSNPKSLDLEFPKEAFSVSSNSSFMSSAITTGDITGDGSVSNGKLGSSLFLVPAVSAAKPPLSSTSLKNICHDHSDNVSGKRSGSNKCHCIKKRKNRMKRTLRVPAVSSRIADIPADEYSWRKYGQKPIKGSPYPRGYYRCSTVKECPARKKVERAMDDPTMLIVTYEEEHRHEIHTAMQENISGSMGLVVFESTLGGN